MILLESAYFNPSSIRRTSRELAMGTDAAFRFERGIDPEGVIRALDRAARLMAELSGGTRLQGGDRSVSPEGRDGEGGFPCGSGGCNDVLGIAVPDGGDRSHP